ncbi:hypothetical protein J437_LFUL016702 [Ladona fulva]|uniref:DUF4780 domain-containing protein n=1 Tax=Ladona fulva TaxID=123851 RepID=A0A8K0KNN7_LADFU|nr:hypothetical protein J437_LFUL016702 [Ladona fulva]
MESKLDELWGSTPEGQAQPSFEETRLINGDLEVICEDDYTITWLGKAVEKVGPLAGTIFKAVDADQLVKQKKRPYDRLTSPSGARFVIGADEASADTIAGPDFKNSIDPHKAIFSFLGKPGVEAESEVLGESAKANLQHSRAATGVKEEILSKGKIKVALIQEPRCYKGRIRGLNIRGGQIISSTSADRPRACIYVNGYDVPDPPPNRELEDLLLNRGSQPMFKNNVREEVVDITLCTSSIVHKIKEWRGSGETFLSDHCHILFMLSEEARQAIAYRNQDKIDASVAFCRVASSRPMRKAKKQG